MSAGGRPELELLLRKFEHELLPLDLRTRSALYAEGSCSGVDDEIINDVDVADVADSSIGTVIESVISLICGILSYECYELYLAKCRTSRLA